MKKKTAKKILVIVFATAIAASLAACGSSSSEEVRQASSVDAEVDTAEKTDTGAVDAEDADPEAVEVEIAGSGFSDDVTLEETELYNANGVTVTAEDIDTNSIWGVEIGILITNDSDRDVSVLTRNLVVNGYLLSTSGMYADVSAGESSNEEITLYTSELDRCGIGTIADLEFNIYVEDSSTWDAVDTSDRITLKTSAAGDFSQPVDDSGDTVYDDNGIRVICKGLKDDSFWDEKLVFFVENNTDRSVSVYGENVSVNGFMEDAGFWVELIPDTKAVRGMYLYGMDDLELESMDDITEIEFNLRIIDEDTWEEIDTSDPVTLHFNSEE